jgi:hypothetical protein
MHYFKLLVQMFRGNNKSHVSSRPSNLACVCIVTLIIAVGGLFLLYGCYWQQFV